MKPINIKPTPALIIGTMLTLPSMYFIFISLMKYRFHHPSLYDAASPFLETVGIYDSFGWNINMLFLFGPVLAFFINILSVFELYYASGKDRISVHVSIKKKVWNMVVIVSSTLALILLAVYLFGESCNCRL